MAESTSTLLFAQRIKRVKVSSTSKTSDDQCSTEEQLNAVKKEVVDTDALIERYRKEIEDLKHRLAEREKENEAPTLSRRLSAKEVSGRELPVQTQSIDVMQESRRNACNDRPKHENQATDKTDIDE